MKVCPNCKKPFTEAELKEKAKLKGQRVSEALRTAKMLGEPVGRPREIDYMKLIELRGSGLKMREVAQKMKCSIGKVQRAWKTINTGK